MATLRSERKLAAFNMDGEEKHPRKNLSRGKNAPRINEECVTQVFQDIEGRVTKKMVSKACDRTTSWVLGALSKLDECLLNSQVRLQSGTIPETSRDIPENQERNDDRFQNDFHSEVGATVITSPRTVISLWPCTLQKFNLWIRKITNVQHEANLFAKKMNALFRAFLNYNLRN